MKPYLIHHILENSADQYPDKEAVVHGDCRHSYRDVDRLSNRVANWLLAAGTSKGDRIALLHRNSVDYIGSYFGILKSGAVVVPLSTGSNAVEIERILKDCGASVLISESHFSKTILEILEMVSNPLRSLAFSDEKYHGLGGRYRKTCEYREELSSVSSDRTDTQSIDLDLALIVYTSGSTGQPKGVMLSHLNVVANTQSIVSYLPLTSDDRCMVILPFYYVYGKSLLNTHFLVSGTVVIDNRFTFPNVVLEKMVEEKVTNFAGVPSTYSILVNRSSIAEMSFPDLRYFTQAGGYLPSAIGERLISVIDDQEFYVMYGATEASARLAYLEPQQFSRKMSSFGKPIPNVEMRVVTGEGIEAEPGQEGEIIARGSNIMMGYWNAPEETARVLRDGWYFTGDLGFRDIEGFFHVTGRARDMIKIGIYKVSAREIEDVLFRHPGIHEAAVIGIQDENLGEAVKAVVVTEYQTVLTAEEIVGFCTEHLAGYKVPREVQFVDELPKNEAGKVMKNELSGLFGRR